jgi:hypothetical protein
MLTLKFIIDLCIVILIAMVLCVIGNLILIGLLKLYEFILEYLTYDKRDGGK